MDSQQNKKIAYITGSSRGIGLALTELLLQNGYFVIGLARTNNIEHPNFLFHKIDLSNLEAVETFEFIHDAKEVLLINNAGVLGEIFPVGKLSNRTINEVMILNSLAPQILINQFLRTYGATAEKGQIINISSGAGKRPIQSWATYCASKAAINLYSETVAEEFRENNRSNWSIFAVAPGVVDTTMQDHIRKADPSEFSMLESFISLKEENQLSNPVDVAKKLNHIIRNPLEFDKTVISLRDFD
jgi:benzil reductase ((S)-benzoin forming)